MNKANIVYKRNSIKKSEKLKQSGSFVKYTSFDWISVNKGDIVLFIQRKNDLHPITFKIYLQILRTHKITYLYILSSLVVKHTTGTKINL